MVLLSTLWWVYFDIDAVAGYQAIHRRAGRQRRILARDAYVYLHLPMIAGLLLVALGLRKHLELVAHRSAPTDTALGHAALFAGVIVYLLANQAFWWRIRREIRWFRILGIVLIAALAPVAGPLPPLWELTVLTAVSVTAFDSRRNADLRRQLREPPPSMILTETPPTR